MSPQLHNILGEDGEVLTILSLLQPAETAADKPLGEMSLQEAIQRIYDIAGDEGRAQLVLSLRRTLGDAATDAFTSDEDVTVADLSGELLELADADSRVVLRRLTVADQPADDEIETDEDSAGGGFRDALHRFIAALRHLFNIAGEDGQQLTILSLLVTKEGHQPD